MTTPQVLSRVQTKIGELVLHRRTPQSDPSFTYVELLVDGRTLMSGYSDVSERALAARGIARCTNEPLRVLVGGLGLGHTAHEALKSERVAAVDIIEFVPEVVAWLEQDVLPLASELRHDSRLQVILDDVYGRLSAAPSKQYDLLLVDVDHAPDDPIESASELSTFYTPEGLRRVAQHLTPSGVLGVWSYADNPEFQDVLREVFADVEVDTTLFVDDLYGEEDETNWLFFASNPR